MQTADKIQIALLCVQICVGVQAITTVFFIKSVGITKQQEKDAKEQILLAAISTSSYGIQFSAPCFMDIEAARKGQ
jgi:hypothetical protein